MKIGLFILLLFSAITLNGQEVDKKFVEGTWEVTEVEKSPENPPFSLMTESFRNATFTFNKDESCSIKTTVQNSFFSMITSVVEQSNWRIIKENETTSIRIEKGDKKTLEIFVSIKESEVFFETGKKEDRAYFILKVEKKE